MASVTGCDFPVTAWVGQGVVSPWARVDLNQLYSSTTHENVQLVGGEELTLWSFGGQLGNYVNIQKVALPSGGEQVARYSFIGVRPRGLMTAFGNEVYIASEGHGRIVHLENGSDPLDLLKADMNRYKPVRLPDLPRFIGGAVGGDNVNLVFDAQGFQYIQRGLNGFGIRFGTHNDSDQRHFHTSLCGVGIVI